MKQSLPCAVCQKKLEIEKTKPTIVTSTFKTDMTNVGLMFLISNLLEITFVAFPNF